MEREEIERQADAICDMYDRVYYEVMNRILEDVRNEINTPDRTIQHNLAQVALRELGLSRKPEI